MVQALTHDTRRIFDLDALAGCVPGTDPCPYLFVPEFLRPERLAEVNGDFPALDEPGNFPPEEARYGPAFAEVIEGLHDPELTKLVSEKLDIDLSETTLQMTVRRLSEASDGNVHVDSKNKLVTALIYFAPTWPHAEGRLRLCRSSWGLDDYAAEIPPERGNLIVFKRTDAAFHGFLPFVGERRMLQAYWVKPKRAPVDAEKKLSLKKRFKRLLKHRPR